ncbi:multidrug efflux SMR transporter [Butyrivibrio sp. MB2005]|uniref:DMT family transporter n=1 Tax=Butyrivibrio sp. MB2005 TaxID=1280678 RepID=UPI00042560E5|nr:multidrug efflux SMR transporter [Butyrivibrio sp. MB2005]
MSEKIVQTAGRDQLGKFAPMFAHLNDDVLFTWAVAMKMSNGFSVLMPSIIAGVGYIASAVFLAIALKQLPLGTAYAMWTGMGIVGTTLLGVFLFHEKVFVPQVICVILIVVGIAGLKILAKD